MRVMLLVLTLVLVGCASEPKPKFAVTPQARVVYHASSWGVYAICDRGHLIYLSELGPVTVVANGCTAGIP
jgi:hypothetical protein